MASKAPAPSLEEAAEQAFRLEQSILTKTKAAAAATWELAEALYEFHEIGGWSLLGYDTLNEFLARPELGMSRRQFFQLTKMWGDLVVMRKVQPAALRQLSPSKVQEVLPAVLRGDAKLDVALADAQELGRQDLRKRYGRSGRPALDDDDGTTGSGAPPPTGEEDEGEAPEEVEGEVVDEGPDEPEAPTQPRRQRPQRKADEKIGEEPLESTDEPLDTRRVEGVDGIDFTVGYEGGHDNRLAMWWKADGSFIAAANLDGEVRKRLAAALLEGVDLG